MSETANDLAASISVPTYWRAERLQAFLGIASKMAAEGKLLEVGRLMAALQNSRSQFLQDAFAYLLTGCPHRGFFVEFGACDGLEISNSLMLERSFGWKGILAEPGRSWMRQLRNNRTAKIDDRCVWGKSGEFVEFTETSFPDRSSLSKYHVAAAGEVVDTYRVATVSLVDLLIQHGAPSFIEFLSIDVEGAETEVLRNFPFGQFKFGFICVEQHGADQADAVRNILEDVGYRQIFPKLSEYDGWYVPQTLDHKYTS